MEAFTDRWQVRPPGSNWGDFGPEDEIGRLNWISPQVVRDAAAEIQEGLTFCLSLPLDLPGGDHGPRKPPKLFATGSDDAANMNRPLGANGCGANEVLCDDGVVMSLQYSTQWDALCHLGYPFDSNGDGQTEFLYYNGWRAKHDVFDHDAGGARRLGIDKLAVKGIQTRAVMLDLHREIGEEMRPARYDDVMRTIDRTKADIRRGDVLCVHTGYGRAVMEMAGQPDWRLLRKHGGQLDGSDDRLLEWISNSGIVAIAADNDAVEKPQWVKPDQPAQTVYPLHELCLFKLGIPLGEYWWLSELADALAERGRTAFHLTAPPLRLPGAVGSPVTPIGTI